MPELDYDSSEPCISGASQPMKMRLEARHLLTWDIARPVVGEYSGRGRSAKVEGEWKERMERAEMEKEGFSQPKSSF